MKDIKKRGRILRKENAKRRGRTRERVEANIMKEKMGLLRTRKDPKIF